jgi:hypothetical protein
VKQVVKCSLRRVALYKVENSSSPILPFCDVSGCIRESVDPQAYSVDLIILFCILYTKKRITDMYFIGGNTIENLWKKSMFIFYVVNFNFIFLIKFSSLMPSAVISWLFKCPLFERSFQIRHFTMDLCRNWPNKLYNKLVVSM